MPVPPVPDTEAASSSSGLLPPPAPLQGFAPEEFQRRRTALRAACPNGIILVRGASFSDTSSPNPYRQDASFLYLTGVETPDAYLVLLPDGVPAQSGQRGLAPATREFLFLPPRNAVKEAWDGANLGPGEETEKAVGIEKALSADSLWGVLSGWAARCPVFWIAAPFGQRARFTGEFALMQRILEFAPLAHFNDFRPALGELRSVKSEAEIEIMRRAVMATDRAHRAARKLITSREACSENEVEGAILQAFRQEGARPGFAPIVGGGLHSTILHYDRNSRPLRQGDAVVVDIGGKIDGYCADLTRTYSVGGSFSEQQSAVYSAVLDAYHHVINDFKAGTESLEDITARCKEFFKNHSLRITDGKGEEKTLDNFLPHGISHHLGLDVHDIGPTGTPLKPGSVITVEPGLYFPEENFGVRIEDDFVIAETGMVRLGSPLGVTLEAAEGRED